MTNLRTTIIALLAACLLSGTSRCEIFKLVGGGQVEGKLLNPDERPRKTYVIETRLGGKIVLGPEQVERVVEQSPRDLEYDQVRRRHPDTVAGHWEVAEWCRKHYMSQQRQVHLERIIELDPDHEQARRGLGYRKIEGRWITQEDLMKQRGFVRYKGRWRLPTEVEILEERRKQELAEKNWFIQLKRLREELGSSDYNAAVAEIRKISDPFAHVALRAALEEEPDPRIRRLYLDAVANIGTPPAIQTLVDVSLRDEDEETRATAVDLLSKNPQPEATLGYVEALTDNLNEIVNRAAIGLAALRDPAALRPLVDALVTKHKFQKTNGQPGSIGATFGGSSSGGGGFSGNGGGGLSFGGSPQVVTQTMRNPAVLDALIQMTGVNFNYDEKRWKNWLATQKRVESIDARRD